MTITGSSGDAPEGYLSEHDKRTFTLLTGILGALFFFAQFLVPFASMFIIMGSMRFDQVRLSRGAAWDGGFWYLKEVQSFFPSDGRNVHLERVDPSVLELDAEIPLDSSDIWLLPGSERLWLVSSESMGFFRDGAVEIESLTERLGDISRPFLYQGAPAVVESDPDGFVLRVYQSGAWQRADELTFNPESSCSCDIQVVECKGEPHSFVTRGGYIYYLEGLPVVGGEERSWSIVAKPGTNWLVACVGNEPTVFFYEFHEKRVAGYRQSGGTWSAFFSHPTGIVSDFGIFSSEEDEDYTLFLSNVQATSAVGVVDGKATRETPIDRSFPFSGSSLPFLMLIPQGTMLLLPFILAVILSIQMRKHRVCDYRVEQGSVAFAPLWRRALAQLIDALILAAPMGALIPFWLDFASTGRFEENPFAMLLTMIAAVLIWLAVLFIVFSYLEGRWGLTPGKWLFGIRVTGIDLEPCGFGRALIRNALKFVDGFFNYMVGILMVALTENWQRVGDLAARTVVVQARGSGRRSIPRL